MGKVQGWAAGITGRDDLGAEECQDGGEHGELAFVRRGVCELICLGRSRGWRGKARNGSRMLSSRGSPCFFSQEYVAAVAAVAVASSWLILASAGTIGTPPIFATHPHLRSPL